MFEAEAPEGPPNRERVSTTQKRGNLPPNRKYGQKMPQIEIFPRKPRDFEKWAKLPQIPDFGASKPYRVKFPYIFLVLVPTPFAHRGSIFADFDFSNSGINFNEKGMPENFRKNPVLEPPSD